VRSEESSNSVLSQSALQIGRALLVRNHAAGLPMIIQVFDLFTQDNEVAALAGASLSILSDSHGDRILSKENFAIVKVSPGIALLVRLGADDRHLLRLCTSNAYSVASCPS
jgi:hypothetical protein